MSFDAKTLYELLPVIYRIRDAASGEPLKELLSVAADEIAVIEENLRQLYDDQFIETCDEWVVPYIGDLIGCRPLHAIPSRVASARAEVAHTIGFRRRKGTAAVLEQLASDVTGWRARVVEFFQLLATTQHMNHVRPGNAYGPDLRKWEPLKRLNSAFESTAHTVDVRNVATGEGKYNIPNIGVFLWRIDAYPLTKSPAEKLNSSPTDQRYLFSPLRNNVQLYTLPQTDDEVTQLANPINVPEPISRRVLDAHLTDYYGPGRSLLIVNNNVEVPHDQIIAADLSDGAPGQWAHQPPEDDPVTGVVAKIAVDPVLGRIAFPASLAPTSPPVVTFQYGFAAAMGGGEYERAHSFDGDLAKVATPIPVPTINHPTVDAALTALGAASGIVEIVDSARHVLPTTIKVQANQQIEIRAADGYRPCIVLSNDLAIDGDANSTVLLNGLLIAGNGLKVEASSQLGWLRISHCTLVPGWGFNDDGTPSEPGAVSLTIASKSTQFALDHCIVGGVRAAATSQVSIRDSIVDAGGEAQLAFADEAGLNPGAPLKIENSTVIGRVHTVALELASNVLFVARVNGSGGMNEPVLSVRKQSGCVRFSYLPEGSRVPRRFRCQPDLAIADAIAATTKKNGAISSPEIDTLASQIRAWLKPGFVDLRYGQPGYALLRMSTPKEIRSGADDESEMGAFHELYQPQRETNLRVRLNEYLRFGLEAGVFYAN